MPLLKPRVTFVEALSLGLTLVALTVAIVTAYRQFWHVDNKIEATVLAASITNTSAFSRIALVNGSSQEIALMSFGMTVLERNSGQHQWVGIGTPRIQPELPLVLPPKSIRVLYVEYPMDISSLYTSHAAYLPEQGDEATRQQLSPTTRQVHIGISLTTLDVNGNDASGFFHVSTQNIEPTLTTTGRFGQYRLNLVMPDDARKKDWSHLRPMPTE